MIKSLSRILLLVISFALLHEAALSQEEITKNQFENVLGRFINYRFGTISVYKLKNISDVKNIIKQREQAAAGGGMTIDSSIFKIVPEATIIKVCDQVTIGTQIPMIPGALEQQGVEVPPSDILDKIIAYCQLKNRVTANTEISSVYLITTRAKLHEIPNSIIAMIVSTNTPDDLEKDLKRVSAADIYTFDEMRAIKLDTANFSADNLYDLMVNSLIQGNVDDKTINAQGIGNSQWFVTQVFGKTESIIEREANVSSFGIQNIMRVSEGQPTDYRLNRNEVIASPDLLSWRLYKLPVYYDATGAPVVDSLQSTNTDLPQFGVELRYGIEDINFPSFWSERLTLNAIWENGKLGIILPTNGWASLGSDVFQQTRKLTYGGVGISGQFDFPIKVIPESGIFHVSFGYVFGDAKESPYKVRNFNDPEGILRSNDKDYLIRTNAQIHYTFGVQIDKDYLMRFGLGGTVYNAESWFYTRSNEDSTTLKYQKVGSETIGGISGRLDFMARNIITPFGATLQYFDEALYANLWLQIPVVGNTFAVRLDAKGYFVAFRDALHQWENRSVFIPMARFIITF